MRCAARELTTRVPHWRYRAKSFQFLTTVLASSSKVLAILASVSLKPSVRSLPRCGTI